MTWDRGVVDAIEHLVIWTGHYRHAAPRWRRRSAVCVLDGRAVPRARLALTEHEQRQREQAGASAIQLSVMVAVRDDAKRSFIPIHLSAKSCLPSSRTSLRASGNLPSAARSTPLTTRQVPWPFPRMYLAIAMYVRRPAPVHTTGHGLFPTRRLTRTCLSAGPGSLAQCATSNTTPLFWEQGIFNSVDVLATTSKLTGQVAALQASCTSQASRVAALQASGTSQATQIAALQAQLAALQDAFVKQCGAPASAASCAAAPSQTTRPARLRQATCCPSSLGARSAALRSSARSPSSLPGVLRPSAERQASSWVASPRRDSNPSRQPSLARRRPIFSSTTTSPGRAEHAVRRNTTRTHADTA